MLSKINIYIYIYIERERERERESVCGGVLITLVKEGQAEHLPPLSKSAKCQVNCLMFEALP